MKLLELKQKIFDEMNNIKNYKKEVELILKEALNIDEKQLILNEYKEVASDDIDKCMQMVKERVAGKPIQYIIGKTEFMGFEFKVKKGVLIPRQDTETLVEEVLNVAEDDFKILDICTGTGCIGISLKKFNESLDVTCSDISKEALELTKENSKDLDIQIIESDLFEKIEGKFDMITANPPYINKEDYEMLEKKVKDFEPELALYGGDDGLDFYKKIIIEAKEHLKEQGFLFLEIGYDQAKDVEKIFENENYKEIQVIKDLAGHDRVVFAKKI